MTLTGNNIINNVTLRKLTSKVTAEKGMLPLKKPILEWLQLRNK